MEEKVEYYKDLKNGFYKERNRAKKDFLLKGTATIQLFEGDNLVTEVVSRNCVCEKWVSALYIDFVNEVFLKKSRQYTGSGILSYLNLSTYSGEENPNDALAYGSVVGYAYLNSTYSGSDTKRGTLNEAESSISEWGRHIVIDFPTHAANGTFSSIYMSRNYNIGFMDSTISKEMAIGKDFNVVRESLLLSISGNRYIFFNDKGIEIYQKGSNVSIARVDLAQPTDYENLQWTGGVHKNLIYMRFRSENKLRIFNELDLSVVTTMTLDLISIYAMEFHEDHMYIVGSEESEKYAVFKYKLNGERIGKLFDVPKCRDYGSNNISYGSFVYGNNIYITMIDYYEEFHYIYVINTLDDSHDIWEGAVSFYTKNNYSSERYYNCSKSFQYGNKIISSFYYRNGSNYSGVLNEHTIMPYVSHTKLPAPVTKTSANTMKIQYDYEIEPKEVFG